MSITSKPPKLLLSLTPKTLKLQTSLLHSKPHQQLINGKPPKTEYHHINILNIVDILKSNTPENWKTNQQLSQQLFSDNIPISSESIFQITRHLGRLSTALSFVEYLRTKSITPDVDLLSGAFHGVFELACRIPDYEDEMFKLFNISKQLGVPLKPDAAVLLIRVFSMGAMFDKTVMMYEELDPQLRKLYVREVLIVELLRNRRFEYAFKVLDEMLEPNSKFPPKSSTADKVLGLMVRAENDDVPAFGDEIVEVMERFGRNHRVFPSSVGLTVAITGLCKSRRKNVAWNLLHSMLELDAPVEVESCNALLTSLAKGRQFDKMKLLLEKMRAEGISPNVVTLGISIDHLCKSSRIDEALSLFEKMRRGDGCVPIKPDVIAYNTLINGLCKDGRVEEGLSLMRKMVVESKCKPTSATYNCLIDGFWKAGNLDRSLELFHEMEKKGVEPNIITVNSLVRGMCSHDMVGRALKFYREMEEKGLKGNKVTYTTLIGGFCGVNNIDKAMDLFSEMKQTCAPDAIVYYTLISGLSRAGLMDDAESFYLEMTGAGFNPDIQCYNVMINGFCKKNKVDRVHWLLEQMERARVKPDSITYNTLISHFSKSDLKAAQSFLEEMINNSIAPTVYTYGALIDGCCSVGQFNDAMKIFRQMSSSSKVPPNTVIYNILIDSLCRQKDMKAAISLFEDMTIKGVTPDTNTFNTLFKGLRDEKWVEKAFELMEKMIELACRPDCITMEVLTEWLSAVGEVDKLRQFVKGHSQAT